MKLIEGVGEINRQSDGRGGGELKSGLSKKESTLRGARREAELDRSKEGGEERTEKVQRIMTGELVKTLSHRDRTKGSGRGRGSGGRGGRRLNHLRDRMEEGR